MSFLILASVALGQAPPVAPGVSDTPEKPPLTLPRIPVYGLNVGTYLPASTRVRDQFGGNWFSFSPGLGPVLPPPIPMRLFDFTLATQRRSRAGFNNRAFLAIVAPQYQWPLFTVPPQEGESLRLPTFLPYAGVSVGGAYANLRSEGLGVNGSGFAPAGSLYVGTAIGLGAFAEARWRTVGKIRGFDLSGLELGAGFRF